MKRGENEVTRRERDTHLRVRTYSTVIHRHHHHRRGHHHLSLSTSSTSSSRFAFPSSAPSQFSQFFRLHQHRKHRQSDGAAPDSDLRIFIPSAAQEVALIGPDSGYFFLGLLNLFFPSRFCPRRHGFQAQVLCSIVPVLHLGILRKTRGKKIQKIEKSRGGD